MNSHDNNNGQYVDPRDCDVMEWTLADLIYLSNLPRFDRGDINKNIYSLGKQAHHARLLIVFGSALIEGYIRCIADETGIAKKLSKQPKDVSVIELIQKIHYPLEYLTVGSLGELDARLAGIRNLRHIIVHGVDFETANNYAEKKKSIESAGLEPNPTNLTETHFNIVWETFDNVMNILTSGVISRGTGA